MIASNLPTALIQCLLVLVCICGCAKRPSAADLAETGSSQLAAKDYAQAAINLSRAENLAKKEGDSFLLGRIYRLQGESCDATGNYPDAIRAYIKSIKAYEKAGKPANARQSLYQAGLAYYNVQDYRQAEQAFRSVVYEAHQAADSLMESSALDAYANLCLEQENQDPALAISILTRVSQELGFPLQCREQGMMAYAYSLLGNDKEAQRWLRVASRNAVSEEEKSQVKFREYQIAIRSGDYRTALSSLEDVMQYNNKVQLSELRDSVMRYQMEYFSEQSNTAQEKLRSARLRNMLIIALLLAAWFSLLGYFRVRKIDTERLLEEEKQEREKYMSLAEELKGRLRTAPNFDVLERLCEKYYVYEGTENLQPKILSEVKSVIGGLREDPKQVETLEKMLDNSRDGIVTKFKEQIPRLKDDDIRIFVFAASGLSSTAMSTLLELDKPVVYNRIYRLKGRIAKSEAPDKEIFLDALNS